MKNTIKLIGNPTRALEPKVRRAKVPLVIIAVVAVIGLSFATCGEVDTVVVFSNESNYDVNVRFPDCTPSSHTLKRLETQADDADEVTVTKEGGGKITPDWDIGGALKSMVELDLSGSKAIFKDATPRWSVKQ